MVKVPEDHLYEIDGNVRSSPRTILVIRIAFSWWLLLYTSCFLPTRLMNMFYRSFYGPHPSIRYFNPIIRNCVPRQAVGYVDHHVDDHCFVLLSFDYVSRASVPESGDMCENR